MQRVYIYVEICKHESMQNTTYGLLVTCVNAKQCKGSRYIIKGNEWVQLMLHLRPLPSCDEALRSDYRWLTQMSGFDPSQLRHRLARYW